MMTVSKEDTVIETMVDALLREPRQLPPPEPIQDEGRIPSLRHHQRILRCNNTIKSHLSGAPQTNHLQASTITHHRPRPKPASCSYTLVPWAKPCNQADFHDWLRKTHLRVFRSMDRPFGIVPIEAPVVKGLTVYAAGSGQMKFFTAWTEQGGTFIGWMRIQPHFSGIDSDYAVGEVLGRPVFVGISLDLSGHDAIDKFVLALKEAAWDLGLAGG